MLWRRVMNDDVYLKYMSTNSDCELRRPFFYIKDGVYQCMFNTMHMHCVNINDNVENEINKYNNTHSPYYVRKFIKSNAFIDVMTVLSMVSLAIIMIIVITKLDMDVGYFIKILYRVLDY